MNRGYVKFWRKALDSASWNRGLAYQGLIINFLCRAAWKKGGYQGRHLNPGQFGAVMSRLAEELGVPRSTLQRMVAHLEADGFLKAENAGNRFVIITITNWRIYQDAEKEAGQPPGSRRATAGQPSYKEEERRKEKERIQEDSLRSSSPPEPGKPARGEAAPHAGAAGSDCGTAGLDCEGPGPARGEAILERERPGPARGESVPFCPVFDCVISLPLNAGPDHEVTWGDVEMLRELYPAVDVEQALRNMRGWLLGNPGRRKTRRGIARFMHNWLAREQDRAGQFLAGQFQAGSFQAGQFLAGSFQAGQFQTGLLQSEKAQAGQVQAGHLQTRPFQAGQFQPGPFQSETFQSERFQAGPVQAGQFRAGPVLAPSTYAQAQDFERRQRAERLLRGDYGEFANHFAGTGQDVRASAAADSGGGTGGDSLGMAGDLCPPDG